MRTVTENSPILTFDGATRPLELCLRAEDFVGKFYDDSINGVLPTAARRTWPGNYILTNGIDMSIGNVHYQHEHYTHLMFFEDSEQALMCGYDNTVIRTLILERQL